MQVLWVIYCWNCVLEKKWWLYYHHTSDLKINSSFNQLISFQYFDKLKTEVKHWLTATTEKYSKEYMKEESSIALEVPVFQYLTKWFPKQNKTKKKRLCQVDKI